MVLMLLATVYLVIATYSAMNDYKLSVPITFTLFACAFFAESVAFFVM